MHPDAVFLELSFRMTLGLSLRLHPASVLFVPEFLGSNPVASLLLMCVFHSP